MSDSGEFEFVLEKDTQKEALKAPSLYKVILNNDDYTPMDFVVEVLIKFFNKNVDQATEIMLVIHYKGKALCGTYTAEVAETKVNQVSSFACENQHPLMCVMEKA